jgi:hypothetical protein
MSVMLRTTNPGAADEMDPAHDRRVPYVGQWLVFHMRPGEGRGGKLQAPAVVIRVEDNDHVELVVFHAADDQITRWKIPRRTEQNPVNAWAFNDWDEVHYQPGSHVVEAPKPEGHLDWEDVRKMHEEMAALRGRVLHLENVRDALAEAQKKMAAEASRQQSGKR